MFSKALVVTLALAGVAAHAESPPVRDPMQPFQAAPRSDGVDAGPRRYELRAVLISAERRVAVLNGKRYREGDLVDGAEIVRIEPRAVHLRRGGEDVVIELRRSRSAARVGEGDSGS